MGAYLSVLFLGLSLLTWALIAAGALIFIALVRVAVKICVSKKKHREEAALAEAAARAPALAVPAFPEAPIPIYKEEPVRKKEPSIKEDLSCNEKHGYAEASEDRCGQRLKYVEIRCDPVNEGDEPMKRYVPVLNDKPIRGYIEVGTSARHIIK